MPISLIREIKFSRILIVLQYALCGFISDVTDSTTYDTAVEEVTALCGDIGLNLLLHNAGIHIVNNFTNVSEDAMMQVYKTNTVAPLILSKVIEFDLSSVSLISPEFHPWLAEIPAPIGSPEVAGHAHEWLLMIG